MKPTKISTGRTNKQVATPFIVKNNVKNKMMPILVAMARDRRCHWDVLMVKFQQ